MNDERRTTNDQPPCSRCPKVLGSSCCEVKGDEQLATLTRDDVRRISAATRRAAATFVDEEVLSHDDAHEYEARRPLYRGYFRRAPVRLTLKRRDGACVFHSASSGCSLSAQVRPLACRLYPFEQLPDGSWSVQVGRYESVELARGASDACLAVEEAASMDELLDAFGMSRSDVEALGAELRRAVARHAS